MNLTLKKDYWHPLPLMQAMISAAARNSFVHLAGTLTMLRHYYSRLYYLKSFEQREE